MRPTGFKILTALALQLLVWHGPRPDPKEMASVLAAKESPVNFTNVRPAIPEGPTVVMINSESTVIPAPPQPLRLDGTPRTQAPATYGGARLGRRHHR